MKIENTKANCQGLSVLLVDDEKAAREQVHSILTLLFNVVYSAEDGLDALEVYKEKKPDIIITDITMPRMDGFGLIKEVRLLKHNQKIIVMSAHTEADTIVKAIKSSVDGYILKPIEAAQMFEALDKAANSLRIENDNIAYKNNLELMVETQAKKIIEQLEYDSTTGIANKSKLDLEFRDHCYSELILLNIDNFSQINFTYGYKYGDLLLKEVALFLTNLLDASVYKGNGDEFLVPLEKVTAEESLALAEIIKEKTYTKRFNIEKSYIRITFSIGVVTINEDDFELPYSKAKYAITDMRKLHKNIIGQYKEQSEQENYQQKMHEWASKAKLALDFDLLVPYYQPIVNVKTGNVEKYECLARIIHEDKPVSPMYFVEPTRIAGMVTDITRRMILKAFETFSGLDKEFSINITDDDFKEEYLVEYLQESCKKFNINPTQVVLEVLENISDYDAGHAILQIDKLKSIGFQIAIDDFGAESSNFARVQKLQIDYLKIDGAFIKDIAHNHNSLVIVKTIIFYAKSSNVKTIAEFVHDEESYNIVKELGIDYVQGYHFYEPLKNVL